MGKEKKEITKEILTLFDEVVCEMNSGIYDFTKNGECIGCGSCCSNFLPLSDKEKVRIRHYIEKNHIKEQRSNFPMPDKAIKSSCPFRSEVEHKCLIYKIRPEICRDFKCNKYGANKGKVSRKLLEDHYELADMRMTFYGGDAN